MGEEWDTRKRIPITVNMIRRSQSTLRKKIQNAIIDDRPRKLISNRAKISIAQLILLGVELDDGVCGTSEMTEVFVILRNWINRIDSATIVLNDVELEKAL